MRGMSTLLMQMTFKRLITEVVEGYFKICEDKMFVELFELEHHGFVRGYGDGVCHTKLWGSSLSTFRNL